MSVMGLHEVPVSLHYACMNETSEVTAFITRLGERVAWVPIDRSRAMPSVAYVEAKLEQPACAVAMHVVVDATGDVRVKRVVVEVPMPGAASITSSVMRGVLVDRLTRRAITELAQPIELLPELGVGLYRVVGESANTARGGPVPRAAGRGRRTPRERIAEAAQVYREAVEAGSSAPVQAVADAMGYSQPQASRDLKRARVDGLLDDVPPPVAGVRPSHFKEDS